MPARLKAADDIETAQTRHLQIEKHEIRAQFENRSQCGNAILRLAGNHDVVDLLQFLAQHFAGNWLVIDNQGLHHCHAAIRPGVIA